MKMNIAVDINHPAHVHFFKFFIQEMKKRGNNLLITASGKKIVFELLEYNDIDYVNFGNYGHSLIEKGINLPLMDFKMLSTTLKFKPDIFLGVGSIRAAHISRLLNKTSVTFEDTEHSREQYRLYAPFTDFILTPDNYLLDLGNKQIRYKGDQKIAYLHPHWFHPNPNVLDSLGLEKDDPFSILRFISWEATHDADQFGIINKIKLIEELEKYGRVFVSSEQILPPELDRFTPKCHPALIHDLLYYSSLYLGEGASMATEAALLGTPSVYISSLAHSMGNLEELEKKYKLLYSFSDSEEALKFAINLISENNSKSVWADRRNRLLSEKIDVTEFMIEFVEKIYNNKLFCNK